MTNTVEFFYDYASPFSYLADSQLPAIVAKHGAKIDYGPAILGVLIVESGNQPPPTVPAKLAYMNADMRRWARLKKNCDEALARGAFGLPTFFVNGEMFFGNDRVDFVGEALAR